MKKFLVFLVSLVVVVCAGLTTYYFMRNNEIITIKTKEIYCNAGDTIPLNSLGIKIDKANVSKKTTFDYNAGGENVTKYIEFDAESQAYVVSQENGGEVTLIIRTSNKKYGDFKISVHIGNGTAANPYYIFNESQLMKIGSTYRLDSHYRLMNDITLTSNFKPIGYNYNTNEWSEFNGTFDGQGYSIKGLNLNNCDAPRAGFFSTLGTNSVVKNLTIDNATISGSHNYVGVLAGIGQGNVEKVVIKNSTISNTANASHNGALVGSYVGSTLKLSYADNVALNIGSADVASQSVVGGLVGYLNQTTVRACYTNNVTINITNSDAFAGGLVGGFMIGTQTGSIQQSYANTTSTYTNFGAFVGEIKAVEGFNAAEANMLRHLIGNFAIVYGKASQAEISDTDLVKKYDTEYFKNSKNVGNSVFFDNGESALYLVRGFISASDVITTNEFIYYAIDMNTIEKWDTMYVWNVSNNSLPILRMGSIEPTQPSGEYFRRDLTETALGNTETFKDVFKADIKDQNITLLEDMELTSGWTPVSVTNSTIDGNGKTISINMNNAVGGNLGIFTVLDNSTIKNLNIIVTGVSANATNAGALAGIIKSSSDTVSSIENVTITYSNFATPVITNFGGLAGQIEKAKIDGVKVSSLVIKSDASVANAGAIAGVINSSVDISNSAIYTSTIQGSENVGAIAGTNNGTIKTITGDATVKLKASVNGANVGGFVGINNGTISNIWLNLKVEVVAAYQNSYVGGVSAVNNGTISNVETRGVGITVNSTLTGNVYIGGISAVNNGVIQDTIASMSNVGNYVSGKNHQVGGVSAVNNGTISRVVIQSNLAGNIVAGVVAKMNNSNASIDQVVVGKFDASTQELSKNTITADKYIAGVVVDFQAGKITNIQASSKLAGESSNTRASLVVLVFPYGATLKNATINSSFSGYFVSTYRETWTDFASYQNKSEFGLENGETGDERFNLYKYDTFHGIMQSVVINTTNDGVANSKAAMGAAFAWGKDYQDTDESSFIKYVDGFSDVSQFQNSFEFVCATSTLFGIKHKATKTLTFQIGVEWCSSKNGISLKCLWDLFNIN